MPQPPNILFIMCDQLRWDYLACAGHPHLDTPHIDALAARGVRFANAFCQAPLCGPSRMCFYTGRSLFSHGANWNQDALRLDDWTLGDYLRPLGVRPVLMGKTHHTPDRAAMQRLGIDPASDVGALLGEGGWEPFERDDGLHPDALLRPNLPYNQWLRERGYTHPNPWQHYANSGVDEHGTVVDGWLLRNARYPANIAAGHSETAYMTTRAIEFIDAAGDGPWCLHLSFIKPHWPLIAPAPYHALYGADAVIPAVRDAAELRDPHPVYGAFAQLAYSRTYARDDVRRAVIPTYMGLITQIDDEIGRLLAHLDARNLTDRTVIVFTSDHGDYLGDHWLGEKDLFHDPSVRIPLIIADPRPEADATRGTVERRFVESLDLVPTFIEMAGGTPPEERLEGRSLLPLLRGDSAEAWRTFTVSETDYSGRDVMQMLGLAPQACRAWMVRTERWVYILHDQFRPQLYDLENDPQQFVDLGADADYAAARATLHEMLFVWMRQRKLRLTRTRDEIRQSAGAAADERDGIVIGRW